MQIVTLVLESELIMSTSVLEIDKSPVLEDVRDLNQLSLSLGEVNQSSQHLGRVDSVSPVLENAKKDISCFG